jgi:Bacterial PH domain
VRLRRAVRAAPGPLNADVRSQEMGMPEVYRSKIDLWLAVVLVGVPVVSGYLIVRRLPSDSSDSWLGLVVCALVLAFSLWLFVSTRYTIDQDALHVRSGPVSCTIALKDIRQISPTRTMSSGPALSLDRLHIIYGNWQECVVSPKDKEGFLRSLRERGVAAT